MLGIHPWHLHCTWCVLFQSTQNLCTKNVILSSDSWSAIFVSARRLCFAPRPSVCVSVCPSVRVSTICLLPAILRRRWLVRRQNWHTHSLEANAEPLPDSFHIGLLLRHHEAMFCHRPCGICLLPAILRRRWSAHHQNGHTHSLRANAEPLPHSFHIGLL